MDAKNERLAQILDRNSMQIEERLFFHMQIDVQLFYELKMLYDGTRHWPVSLRYVY